MRVAYFDCFAGASGDMILGALMDVGLGLGALRSSVAQLGIDHYSLDREKVTKRGIRGTQAIVQVDPEADHHHRGLPDIKKIINRSGLSSGIKQRSKAIFQRLAQAEAKVHQIPIEKVHFHEVGALDAIIDVVGAVAGLEMLGIESIHCAPLHVGSGTVTCAHGVLPVPAPATAELIQHTPVYSTGIKGELLTPTGAAILTTLANDFGPIPPMQIHTVGYGAGTANRDIPNLLRLFIGDMASPGASNALGCDVEQAAVVETQIDDMSPQLYDYLMDRLFHLEVRDVYLTPIQMKKNRPGTQVTVICATDAVGAVAQCLMAETTTIGLRWRVENRIMARRRIDMIETPYGSVRIKIAEDKEGIVNYSPEYEDCKQLAAAAKVPLKSVMDVARSAARKKLGSE